MESIREIFKIGKGPSSSHSIGPSRAAETFRKKFPQATHFEVTLYGSLAATGKGHLTDKAIFDVLGEEKTTIHWKAEITLPEHPNGMKFEGFDNIKLGEWTVFSIGGGTLSETGKPPTQNSLYPLTKMDDILVWCKENGKTLWQYVEEHEGPEIWPYLQNIWNWMQTAIVRGLETEGTLPGGLGLPRKAPSYYIKLQSHKESLRRRNMVFAYALAVAEENASGNMIVTAPTCGSAGVLPAVLYLIRQNNEFAESRTLKALATAGLIGNLIKENASISGAAVGCQGEIGAACSMAAGAAAQLFGCTPAQIEYAAAMGLEHFLGLTCDPVCGLVQIPCIERNAFAAAKALDANVYASLSDGQHMVSFDKVVQVMNQTGHDLPSIYKETSAGGLALFANRKK